MFNCNSLTALLRKKPLTQADRTLLASSQCGWSGNYPLVCCSDGIQQQNGGGVNPAPAPAPGPAPVPKVSSLPRPGEGQCGLDTSDRIYGGEATKIDEYPWLALLQYTKSKHLLFFLET